MVVIMIGFTNCTSSNPKITKLKNVIKSVNKECPINMGIMGTMTSAEYNDQKNEVKFKISLNENIIPITLLETKEFKDLVKMSFSKSRMKGIDLLIDAEAGFICEYKGPLTGKCVEINLSLEDLKEIKNNAISEVDIYGVILKLRNTLCPVDLGNGLVLEQIYDDGENIVQIYQIDETEGAISEILANKKEMKQKLVDCGMFEDPTMKNDFRFMILLEKGMLCRFRGNTSGEYVDIEFTKEELESFL